MPSEIEEYNPQAILKYRKRQAVKVYSIFAFLAAIWVFVILLAPFAAANGSFGISALIYKFFSYICHQMPARSFQLENHSFAVCSRCFGVYIGLLSGFIIYPFFRAIDEVEPLPRFWLFLSLIPMGIDWSLGFFEIWDNTHFSRFLTGLILGVTCAVFIIPALVELTQLLSSKKKIKRLSL